MKRLPCLDRGKRSVRASLLWMILLAASVCMSVAAAADAPAPAAADEDGRSLPGAPPLTADSPPEPGAPSPWATVSEPAEAEPAAPVASVPAPAALPALLPASPTGDDPLPQSRPIISSNELVVLSESPRALVWDADRHAGALAVRGAVLVLSELRDAAGLPAGALKLVASVAIDQVEHLALGRDDGSVYASSTRRGKLHALALADGSERFVLAAGGPQPAVLFHHPIQHRLASFNAGANTITVFDTGSQAFTGLIPLGDAPVAVRMSPDGRVLALLPDRRELTLITLNPLRIGARWALPEECVHPVDFDVDPTGQRVLIACGTPEIAVFDYREAEWRSNLQTGTGGAPAAVDRVFWDGKQARVLAVGSDGVISRAGADADSVRALAVVSPGSLVDLDAAGDRMLWARPDEPSGVRLGFTDLH